MALKQFNNGLIMLLVGLLVVLPVTYAIKLKSKLHKYYIYTGFALSGGLIIAGIVLMATATKETVPPVTLPKTCDPLCSGMTPICEAGTCVKCDAIRMCPTATPYCNMDGSCTVPIEAPVITPTTTTTIVVPPPTTTTTTIVSPTTIVPPPTTTTNVPPTMMSTNSDFYSWVAWYDLDPNTPNPPEGTLGKTPWGSNLTVFPVAAINKNGKAIFGSTFTDKAARGLNGTVRAWYSRRNETGPDIGPNKGTAGMGYDVNNSAPLYVLKLNQDAPPGCGDPLKRGDVSTMLTFNGQGVCINDGYATAYDDTTKMCEQWADRPVGTFEPLSRAC